MSKRFLTVSLAIAVASALIFIPLTAGGQEGRSNGAQPGAAVPSDEGGGTVDQGTWDGDGPAPRDQQILDDLIVDGSACIGQDCVNGESFGFDTLRLKENNLRIKAQDTSSTASFPSADWQITFNDSTNGGQNKFSIDNITDPGGRTPLTIEAGAPSHALYVDDGGRIGFGTSTPTVELHVIDGNTPTLRLEQDGSQGFSQQTYDVAANEANFFIRDATNGSTLPFRIRPGAPTSAIDVAASGDVGIGTSSPSADLHVLNGDAKVTADGAVGFTVERASGGVGFVLNADQATEAGSFWQFTHAGNGNLRINLAGDVGGVTEMELDTNGNLTVFGTITCEGGTKTSTVGPGC